MQKKQFVRISLALALSLTTGVSIAASSRSNDMPNDQVRAYAPISNGTDATLGNMKLSKSSASFSKLTGKMQLRYAGVRKPENGDTEFSGDVYQVMNADAFFKSNKGKNGFCDEPVKWVTIGDLSVGGIRIGMLSSVDWKKYTSTSTEGCSADSFALQGE
ncbi:hypothetical protein A6U85_30310 [Agrobacterium sp. 13-626]|nr:hypothetical protein A6U85_30310 [Agrobacterium sp. 13-626]